jgi:hypothetical protein
MRKQEEGVLQNSPKLEGKKETNKKHQPDLDSDTKTEMQETYRCFTSLACNDFSILD